MRLPHTLVNEYGRYQAIDHILRTAEMNGVHSKIIFFDGKEWYYPWTLEQLNHVLSLIFIEVAHNDALVTMNKDGITFSNLGPTMEQKNQFHNFIGQTYNLEKLIEDEIANNPKGESARIFKNQGAPKP